MNYLKRIEKVQNNFSTLGKHFGNDEWGLMATFSFEKFGSVPDRVDTNFIAAISSSRPEHVSLETHRFNISEPYELAKALSEDENSSLISMDAHDGCEFSINVSLENHEGFEILEGMQGHVALLYALHFENLHKFRVSSSSHRPSVLINSPVQILADSLEFRMFPALRTSTELIKRAGIIYKIFESSVDGESAEDFINRFFKNRGFEVYLPGLTKRRKRGYRSLALKFMRCLMDEKYLFNIGKDSLGAYFHGYRTSGESARTF